MTGRWHIVTLFLQKAKEDGRLGPSHVSLYLALLFCAGDQPAGAFFVIERPVIMQMARISARQTYTKRMQELDSYGYIRYLPSSDLKIRSQVQLLIEKECKPL